MFKAIHWVASVAFALAATALIVWFLWGKLDREPRRELDPFRQTLAEEAVEAAVHDLPRRDEIRKLAILPIVRDVDGRVHDLLYEALEDAELYFLVDDDKVAEHLAEKRDRKPPLSEAEAVEVGRALKETDAAIEGVLFATLTEMTDGRRGLGARVALECSLVELASGRVVPGGFVQASRSIDRKLSLDYFAATMESTSVLLRLFAALVGIAGLPFALFAPARAVLRRRSTQGNVALLLGLVVLDVLIALALMGFRPGWFGALLLVLVAIGGAEYDSRVLERFDKLG